MSRFPRLGVILLLLLPLGTPAQAIHSLQGKVVLASGNPPAHPVKITLTFSGRRIHETFSDLSGRFFFAGLARGVYQLTAEGDGQTFETTSTTAEVLAYGSAPQTFSQNIQLRSKTGTLLGAVGTVAVEEVDPAIPVKAREEYQKGLKQARADKPHDAIKHFKQAVAAYPEFYLAQVALAEQLSKNREFDDALAAYQKAAELRPGRADPLIGAGIVLVKQQKYSEALTPLRRSIEIKADSADALLFLGLAEMMTGELESAESRLLRAFELAKPAIAHIYLANLYELTGEFARAIKHLESFLVENPGSPHARQIREAINKLKKRLERK
jgi:tetratricopeptide (TPR) repeat protein